MTSLLRMIDANANRAREAVRTIEDIARFALDDANISHAAKTLRHDLIAAVGGLGIDWQELLSARDTVSDIGTQISTPAEHKREALIDIASAAGGRLTESLRVIEEAAKALDQAQIAGKTGNSGQMTRAGAFESLRYRAYTLDRDLRLALAKLQCPQWRLCVLITESLCTHHSWLEVARLAIAGGADCIQLREKNLSDAELLARAKALVELVRAEPLPDQPVSVIINDRPDIALLAQAHGVHLGKDDLCISDARKIVGSKLWIGATSSTVDRALEAVEQGADYCGLGPMFASTTKAKPHLAGIELIESYMKHETLCMVPHLAISGIDSFNVGELVQAGCAGVAVCSCVCQEKRPTEVCRALVLGLVGESQ